MIKRIWRAAPLHRYAGLAASFFVVVLGVTGALLAFEDEIDRALNPHLSFVIPQGTHLPWTDLAERAAAHYPGYNAVGMLLPARADLSLDVQLHNAWTRKNIAVAVNPYTGEILGDSEHSNRFMEYVRRMHTGLMLGGPGEALVTFTGLLLVVLAISGVRLWLRRRRYLSPDSALHSTLGAYAAMFVFLFGITALRPVPLGLVWSPPWKNGLPKVSAPQGASRLTAEEFIAAAEKALPGTRAVTVGRAGPGDDSPVGVSLRFPEDHTSMGKSLALLNPYTAQVLAKVNTREMTPLAKYAWLWNWEIHTGQIFGRPSQIVAAALSAGMPLLAITGFLVWWNRRRRVRRQQPQRVVTSELPSREQRAATR